MTTSNSTRFVVVIPARYGSTRLPGKPLKVIAGKTMVRRVYENAAKSGAEETIVALDDERIEAEVAGFGGRFEMTSPNHRSGTDRIAEVARKRGWSPETIVVNLQGDEPGIPPELIRMVATALCDHPDAGISTLATPVPEPADVFNPNVVKVVTDKNGMALYFSRAPIPYARDHFSVGGPVDSLPSDIQWFRHLGLYAYRTEALLAIADHPAEAIEKAESLEQLRAMSMGIRIHVSVIPKAPGHGVDTEEDLQRVASTIGE